MLGANDPIGHALSHAGGSGNGGGFGGAAMGAMGPDDPLYVPEEDDDPSS
jgi:hypothetical protein